MTKKCILKTDGYQISFDVRNVASADEYVDVAVELILDQYLGDIVVKSTPTLIALHDLSRLVKYFERHMVQLLHHPDYQSEIFLPMELGFQIQALAGEAYTENEGGFSLCCLLNVGKSKETGHRVYVGGESVVTFKDIKIFLSSLHEILAALSHPDDMRLSEHL
jgi:hypothetical protein